MEEKREGKLYKQAITQWDMHNIKQQIAIDTGYWNPKNNTFHPTEENIKATTDYEYKNLFIPIEVLDEAKQDFPEIKEQDVTGLPEAKIREMMENKLLEVLQWRKRWFGDGDAEEKTNHG